MSNIELYNGDSSIEMKNIQSESIDCVLTDPPYGVEYKVEFCNDSWEYVESQMPVWYQEWHRVLKPESYLYLFVGVKTLHKWVDSGIKAGFTFKNILATRSFNNGSPTPKNSFGFQFQPIIVLQPHCPY